MPMTSFASRSSCFSWFLVREYFPYRCLDPVDPALEVDSAPWLPKRENVVKDTNGFDQDGWKYLDRGSGRAMVELVGQIYL